MTAKKAKPTKLKAEKQTNKKSAGIFSPLRALNSTATASCSGQNNNNGHHIEPQLLPNEDFAAVKGHQRQESSSSFAMNENDEENIAIDLPDEDEDGYDQDDNKSEKDFGQDAQAAKFQFAANDNQQQENGAKDHYRAQKHYATSAAKSQEDPMEHDSEETNKCKFFKIDDLIWFDPNQLGYCIPGKVLDFYPELMVLTVEGCEQPIPNVDSELARAELQVYELSDPQLFKSIKRREPIVEENGHWDLVDLSGLSLESMIWNLKLRFQQDLIYTKCGQKILFSVNPFKQLDDLYNLKQVNRHDSISAKWAQFVANSSKSNYRQQTSAFARWLVLNGSEARTTVQRSSQKEAESADKEETSVNSWKDSNKHPQQQQQSKPTAPHLFGLANDALKSLLVTGQDQCLVLLGDSGSGKTETCKLLCQYFATINKSPTNLMTELILESIQMLESFGNAKTILNDNSSRFGKLIEINFDLTNGFILDAKLNDLNLLDRGRIVSQSENERNFHVFYELLKGLSTSEKEKYGLQSAKKYFYLNQGNCVDLSFGGDKESTPKDDAEDFRSLLASMQVLGFNYEEQDTIFRILASILHLGNIYFHRKVLAVRSGRLADEHSNEPCKSTGIEGVEIGSDTEVRWLSHLLQIQFDHVMRCLTVRTSEVGSSGGSSTTASGAVHPQTGPECIVTPLNIDQALDTRDAIARALYSCLFKWLVQRINATISNHDQQHSTWGNSTTTQDEDGIRRTSKEHSSEPIYLGRTSESLCEFQPDKLLRNTHKTKRSEFASNNIKQQVSKASVLLLDAFGFESLAENQFEQLCVNYSAELLNYHAQRYLIRLERAEFAREKLKWSAISFATTTTPPATLPPTDSNALDGQHLQLDTSNLGYGSINSSATLNSSGNKSNGYASTVNLISKKPLGILALLDDECNFPKATDLSFAEKCHHTHALNDNYQCARLATTTSDLRDEFGIRHFGQQSRLVWYQVEGFVEKNRDFLRPDVLDLLLGSRMTLVVDMLRKLHFKQAENGLSGGQTSANGLGKTLSRTYDGRYVAMKPRASTAAARYLDTLHNNRALESLGASSEQHHSRQGSLRSSANGSSDANSQPPNPWFVICLRPNGLRTRQYFDVAHVQEQARALNLLDIVRQRKFGYPVRMRYAEFLKRYKCLVTRKFLENFEIFGLIQSKRIQLKQFTSTSDGNNNNNKKHLMKQLKEICCSIIEYQFHRQRLAQELLISVKTGLAKYQCGLSKMFLNEKLFHQLETWRAEAYNEATIEMQKTWQMWTIRREFLLLRRSAVTLQSNWKCCLERRRFLALLDATICLQRRWRQMLILRRRRALEARCREQRLRQQAELQELQAKQIKQANQFRHRLLPSQQMMRAQNQAALNSASSRSSSSSNNSTALYSTNQQQQHQHRSLLDIPEDLAQLYRLQQQTNWLPAHDLSNFSQINLSELYESERRRLSLVRRDKLQQLSVPFVVIEKSDSICDTITEKQNSREEPSNVFLENLDISEQYSMKNFLVKYFPNEVPQIGYSRLPITRPFSHLILSKRKDTHLDRVRRRFQSQDLLEKNEQIIQQRFSELEQKAIAVYKLILRYIDSDHSLLPNLQLTDNENLLEMIKSNEELQVQQVALMQRLLKFKLISDYVSYLCLTEPLLRDEIYLQLISQTWQNQRSRSLDNTWKLMLNCLSCFEPVDRRLANFMLRYANDYCCPRYKQQICQRLAGILQGLQSERAKNSLIRQTIEASPKRELELVQALARQRRLPSTVLEYWCQQVACSRMALSVSCYADDYDGLMQTSATSNSSERQEYSLLGNYSNKTLVCLDSYSRAEQLAQKLLETRGIPPDSQFGWSLEIQHEGELSECSSRLRGDDYVLDHFARLELLPELVQLVDDGLDEFEAEQVDDELGLLVALTRVSDDANDDGEDALDSTGLGYPPEDCCSVCDDGQLGSYSNQQPYGPVADLGTAKNFPPPRPMVKHPYRTSLVSQRSWDTPFEYQNQRLGSRMGQSQTGSMTRGSRPESGEQYLSRQARRVRQPGQLDFDQQQMIPHQQQQYYRGPNRRSMSMQELQLAASNAGLYGMPSSAFECQDLNCCGNYDSTQPQRPGSRQAAPAFRGQGARLSSGSLRQLNQHQQIYYSPSLVSNQSCCAAPSIHHPHQSFLGNKRSSTPNSLGVSAVGTQLSSSAYGSQSSRNKIGSSQASSSRLNHHQSVLGHHQRRTRRSSSSAAQTTATTTSADYGSVQSDYERIGGVQPHQRFQQQIMRRPAIQQQQTQLNKQDNQQHYTASSALSDTSEAPSLASHVRKVKAPQTNGDLDRYLDELFNPLMDDCKDLDEMSDARSLATSIRGRCPMVAANGEATFLEKMCDPLELSKMIQGVQEDEDEDMNDERQQNDTERTNLSPTFESLISSLKNRQRQVLEHLKNGDSCRMTNQEKPQLNEMNLNELKALNEKLENQIQAAQSARNSVQIEAQSLIPDPPPQPSFSELASVSQQQYQADDIYSRAKTIRIGKWRWPPARELNDGTESTPILPTSTEKKRASILSSTSDSTTKTSSGSSIEDEIAAEKAAETAANDNKQAPGRLKISGEMKAKLELLTNSAGTVSASSLSPSTEAANPGSPNETGDEELDPTNPRRLAEERRSLLENQLSGVASKRPSQQQQQQQLQPVQQGLKVLAAKQQLAAAAGLALSALDSSSASSSQASSRRQSSQLVLVQTAATRKNTEEQQLEAEELGPQSRNARIRRENFYRDSLQAAEDGEQLEVKSLIEEKPVDKKEVGSEPKLATHEIEEKVKTAGAGKLFMSAMKDHSSSGPNDQYQQIPLAESWVTSSPRPAKQPDSKQTNKRSSQTAKRSQAAVGQSKKPNDRDQEKLQTTVDCLVYSNVDWEARIRKEIFRPSETYEHAQVCQLIFAQLVADVFNPRHWTRLNNKERAALKSIMKDNSIGYSPSLPKIGQMEPVKRQLIRMARSFGLYFTRPYQALNFACLSESLPENFFAFNAAMNKKSSHSGHSDDSSSSSLDSSSTSNSASNSDQDSLAFRLARRLRAAQNLATEWVDMVALHHSGLRLVVLVNNNISDHDESMEQQQQQQQAKSWRQSSASWRSASRQISGSLPPTQQQPTLGYKVLETLKFRDMTDVALVGARVVLVSMRNGKKCWMLSSNQANQLASLLKSFHEDYNEHLRQTTTTSAKDRPNHHQKSLASTGGGFRNNNQKRQKERQPKDERNNALLASDDDHDGDHLEQRQTPDCVPELHPSAHPNNGLADHKRILPNSLAPNSAPSRERPAAGNSSRPAAAAASSNPKPEEHPYSGSSGSCSSRGNYNNHSNSPTNSPTPRSPNSNQPTTATTTTSLKSDRATHRDDQNHLGRADERSRVGSGGRGRSHPKQPAPAKSGGGDYSETAAGAGKPQLDASEKPSKQRQHQSSAWQNSLSRMSSKFNLFGGGSVRKQEKPKANGEREEEEDEADEQISESTHQQQVALDAWIETKVDFDDEEEEDEDGERYSASGSTLVQNNPETILEQQQKTTTATDDKRRKPEDQQKPEDEHSVAQAQKQPVAPTRDDDGKYSMLQFALHNFREAIDKYSILQVHSSQRSQPGDTSTLRGSLKLIESLRNGQNTLGTDHQTPESSQGNSGSLRSVTSSSATNSNEWTWRELAEMVKFTTKPPKRSLLRLPQVDDLERRALECFAAIMKYMGDIGDQPPSVGSNGKANRHNNNSHNNNNSHHHINAPASEVECVYLILINCHNYPILRDEIYCQLIKQTTNNRQHERTALAGVPNNAANNQQQVGPLVDSCLRGWRLFSIVAAYFDCSQKLRPYLMKYLEQAAYDKRRAYHSVAMLCLQNLRKTFKFRGRKNVPSIEEIAATSAGRNSKRQIYRLPGGTERVINTKSTTVVEDIIQEICSKMLGVEGQNEMLEFSLYCIADGDLYTMPLSRDEYILDITTELIKNHQQYFLIFCRSIWHFPLRLDNKLYIEVTFNQIAPDYLEGLLLILPSIGDDQRRHRQHSSPTETGGDKTNNHISTLGAGSGPSSSSSSPSPLKLKGKLVKEIARIAALLHRASGTDYMPHKDEIRYLLPKPIVQSIKRQHSSRYAKSDLSESSNNSADDILNGHATTTLAYATSANQWLDLVQNYWKEMSAFDTLDAKAQFLDIVRHWPLFGSSFFAIKLIQRDLIQPKAYILAINKLGIQMLDVQTHETHHEYPFSEVVSTRKVRSEDGALFLDIKCGNLQKKTIIRIQTDQAHEISRLIRQYIDIELLSNKSSADREPASGEATAKWD